MQLTFTDLLEDYLRAKKEYDEASRSCEGNPEAAYFLTDESRAFQKAKDALNQFIPGLQQPQAIL